MNRSFSPALVVLAMLLVWAIGDQLVSALSWGHESWQLAEWLINYAGGFVRRGLPGSMIWHLSQATGIQANHLAIAAGFLCYGLLAAWLLRRATGVFPPILILSCVVLGFPAYQDSIVRKDSLGLLLLAACLEMDRSSLPRAWIILGINLAAGLAILSHETFVFYALTAMVMFRSSWVALPRRGSTPKDRERSAQAWTFRLSLASNFRVPLACALGESALPCSLSEGAPPGFLRRAAMLLPAIACFAATVVFHGTPAIADAVNDSWLPLWRVTDPANPMIGEPATAIEGLGWSSEKGLSLALFMLTSGFYQPIAWTMVFVTAFAVLVLFTGRPLGQTTSAAMDAKVELTAILLMQLLFISPLFLLGVDYGRWLFFWTASSIILHTTQRRAPVWMEMLVNQAFEKVRVNWILHRVPASDWILLFIGVPVCWNLSAYLHSSPVGRLWNEVANWF